MLTTPSLALPAAATDADDANPPPAHAFPSPAAVIVADPAKPPGQPQDPLDMLLRQGQVRHCTEFSKGENGVCLSEYFMCEHCGERFEIGYDNRWSANVVRHCNSRNCMKYKSKVEALKSARA